jgi:hypothetical protein
MKFGTRKKGSNKGASRGVLRSPVLAVRCIEIMFDGAKVQRFGMKRNTLPQEQGQKYIHIFRE